MTTDKLYIKDINKDTNVWAVRVMVEAKTQPRRISGGSKRYQRILFVDETGQKVSATIFDPDIDKFKNTFLLYKTYTVSNAHVSKIEAKYDKFGYPYQWIINAKTACNADPEHGISRSIVKNEHTSLTSLKSLIGQNVLVDVLGIVIQKGDMKSFKKDGKDFSFREFAIIDQDKKVVVLTLWNAVAEAEGDLIDKSLDGLPVIRATRLTISPFFDGSLGSTTTTIVEIDPQIPESHNLKTWRSNNLKFIVETIAAKDHLQRNESSGVFPTDHISLIANAVADEKIEKFTVEVHAKVKNSEQKFYYMACQKCYSATDAACDYNYMCVMCGENTRAKPRERIHLNVYDATGSLDVVAFGSPAIYIMQMDSTMCLQLSDGGESITANWINQKLSGKTYFMNIRRKENQVGGTLRQQYTILNVQLKQTDINASTSTSQTTDEADTNKNGPHCKHPLAKELLPEIDQTDSKDKDVPSLFDSSV